MNLTSFQSPRLGWMPAGASLGGASAPLPAARPKWTPSLAQTQPAATFTPPVLVQAPPSKPPSFIDSSLAALIIDVLGLVALVQLSHLYGQAKSYSTARVYAILAGAMGLKGLVDLTDVVKKR